MDTGDVEASNARETHVTGIRKNTHQLRLEARAQAGCVRLPMDWSTNPARELAANSHAIAPSVGCIRVAESEKYRVKIM